MMHSLLHTCRGGLGGGERERVFLFPIYCAFHVLHRERARERERERNT